MRTIIKGEKHFTASVWLRTKGATKKTLLVHHKKMNTWFQPGGHIEQFENPIDAAIREVQEETGIDIRFLRNLIEQYDSLAKALPAPDFFLEEYIPERKDGPEHYHLDLMYVVDVDEQAIVLSEREAHQIGWFTEEEALRLPLFTNTEIVLKKVLSH